MWPFQARPAPPAVKRPPRPTQLHPKRFADADLRRMRLESELDHAQAEAVKARDEVERISRDHLEAAMQRSRAERAKRVDDPELTSIHRQALVASLAGDEAAVGGWRPTLGGSRKDALLRFWGQKRHRVPVAIQAVVLVGPVCAFAIMAYSNTGERIVEASGSELRFVNPDGSHYYATIKRGEEIVVVRHLGEAYARAWKERQGYALAPVTVN